MPVDLNPRIVFHTAYGAVIVVIAPTDLTSGFVQLPMVGSIPYDLDLGTQTVTLHVPAYGDIPIPLTGGGGGPQVVNIPGLGQVPYEITIGDPGIPSDQLFGASIGTVLPWVLAAAVAWWFLRKKK